MGKCVYSVIYWYKWVLNGYFFTHLFYTDSNGNTLLFSSYLHDTHLLIDIKSYTHTYTRTYTYWYSRMSTDIHWQPVGDAEMDLE